MCLAIPGQIITIQESADPLTRKGKVDFSGIGKEVSLAYVPEATIGDYVIIHAGFALSVLNEGDASASLQAFDDLSAFEN